MQSIGAVEYHRFDYTDAIASTCRLDALCNDVSIYWRCEYVTDTDQGIHERISQILITRLILELRSSVSSPDEDVDLNAKTWTCRVDATCSRAEDHPEIHDESLIQYSVPTDIVVIDWQALTALRADQLGVQNYNWRASTIGWARHHGLTIPHF